MIIIDDLLREYEMADMSKRLHMYLQFPDLRPMFAEKERDIIHSEMGPHSVLQKAERDDSRCLNFRIQENAFHHS